MEGRRADEIDWEPLPEISNTDDSSGGKGDQRAGLGIFVVVLRERYET